MATTAPARTTPSGTLAAITPNDTGDFAPCRGVYVGGAGDLHILTEGDDEVTLVGVLAGVIYPIRAKRVFSTGTTATNLIALY